jgi:hypothetical protein
VKIAQTFRTTSYEALSILTSILIELGYLAKCYHISRGNKADGLYDAPKDKRKWSHSAEAVEIRKKCERKEYM